MANAKPTRETKTILTPHTVFQELQNTMLGELNMSKKTILHSPTQGAATEDKWLKLFQNYLPARYRAERGFVMDTREGMSEQIDIIIFDRHFTPFLFNHEGIYYVPAESVYAVIEVKPNLNKPTIKYAGQKIESVRKLHRTSVPIPHAGGTYEPKELFSILGGIVTTGVTWSTNIQSNLLTALKQADNSYQQVDFGCALSSVTFDVEYHAEDEIKLTMQEESVLLTFFMKLLQFLQLKGSVPALDYKAYYEMGK